MTSTVPYVMVEFACYYRHKPRNIITILILSRLVNGTAAVALQVYHYLVRFLVTGCSF